MLKVSNLKKHFNHEFSVGPFSFQLNPGEILFIAGKSGEGKSTLLKMVAGLIPFDEGEIKVDGNLILTSKTPYKIWSIFYEKYGFVFQYSGLIDYLPVWENIALKLLEENKESPEIIKQKVLQVMDLVELPKRIFDAYPAELSGGMQKRVSFARAIIHKPEFLFFDEPTSGLDPILANKIDNLIHKINTETKATMIVVSHDVFSIKHLADKVLLINNHKTHFYGTNKELLNNENNDELIKKFFFRVI